MRRPSRAAGRVRHRRQPGGHRPRRAVPEPGRGLPRPGVRQLRPGAARPGRPGVLRPAPRRVPGAHAGAAREGAVGRRPRRRLPAPGRRAVPDLVRRAPRRPRAAARLRLRPARAPPGRDRRAPPPWPRPAATRPPPPWPWPRSCSTAWSRPRGIVVDAVSGVSGRRPARQAQHHLLHRRRGLHRLRPAHPPAHPGDGADRGPAVGRGAERRERAVHAAPGPDEPGDARHLLPAARRPAPPPPSCSTSTGESYAGETFVVVTEGSPSTKACLGSNTAHVTVRADARTGWIVAIAAIDNLTKGASGQAVQCANILAGLPEQTGLSTTGVYP